MTQPGGHGNDINLAALWIPVMPETSHMGEEMRKAGGEAKRQFEQGFNSGQSPEAMGSTFGSRFSSSVQQSLKGFELPLGLSNMAEKMSSENDKLISKLKGESSQALSAYRTEYEKLTQAEQRAAEAERQIGLARQGGISSAQVMIPLMTEQNRATKELETAHTNAGNALSVYNGKVTALKSATEEAAGASATMAGVMGGLVVAAAQQLSGAITSVVEHVVEGAVEAFKMGAEGAKEFADKMVELGETYERIGIQTTEFASGTQEHLEQLTTHAQAVFGQLDVAGNNVGQTMAQFASVLDAEPSPALDRLTKHVEELQGRYTDLRSTDLASAFFAFKTPVQEADTALASLLQSARNSGQDLGQLTSALSGDAAVTLHEAGLNIQQAGAFMGDLLKMGAPGRSVMMGLQAAMKDFGSVGLSFGDGMKLAGQRLKELGDTAEGQEVAEKLFGTRRWAVAMQAVQDYLGVVEQGPNAFNASASSLDDFITRTRNLQNEWEIVKHKAEEAFLPMGLEALKIVSGGIDSITKYVETHMDSIKHDVILAGLEIIQFARNVQVFGQGLLTFFAPITDAIVNVLYAAIEGMAGFGKAAGGILAFIPGFKDIGEGMQLSSDAAGKMGDQLKNLKIGDKMRDLAQWSKDHPIDVDKASDSWVHFADHVSDAMNQATDAVDKSKGWWGTGGGNQTGTGAPGIGGPGGPLTPPVPPGGVGSPPAPGGPTNPLTAPLGSTTGTDPASVKALAQQLFPWPITEWDSYEKLEMAEAGFDPTAKNASGAFGVGQFLGHEHDKYAAGYSTDPATQLRTQFQYISDRYGTPSAAWAQYYQHPGGAGSYQSGGYVGSSPFDEPTEPIDAAWLRLWWDHKQGHAGSIPIVRPEGHAGGGAVVDPLLELMSGRHGTDTGAGGGNDMTVIDQAMYGGRYIPQASNSYPTSYMVTKPPSGADYKAQQATRTGPFGYPSLGLGPGNINPDVKIDTSHISEGSGGSWLSGYFKRFLYLLDVGGRNVPHGGFATGGPSGTDTVPAWLTPGEYVWDTKTVDKFGWLIKALHNGPGFQGGGPVDDTKAGVDPQLQFIAQIAQGFGLDLGSGFRDPNGPAIAGVSASSSLHGSGEAQDFGNKSQQDQMLAFASYVFEHFGGELAELIHDDPRWTHNVKDGKDVGPMGQFYTTAQAGDHTDHVHVGIRKATSLYDQLSPGNEPLSAGVPGIGGINAPGLPPGVGNGSIPGGTRGSAFPGIPGQYGGQGAYGGETADEASSTANAVRDAQQHASDLDYQIGQQNDTINTLKDQLAHVGDSTKTDALGIPVPLTPAEQTAAADKRKSLERELGSATHQLEVSTRERGDQDGKIADAKRKQLEAYYKKPGGTTGTAEKAVGTSEFSQLGSSLLGGIGQELGFGDLFAKPPWEWGAVKLLTGAASWALGTANAWAEQIGQGKTGIGGPGWGGNSGVAAPGWDQQGSSLLSGLAGSLGINLPKAATPQSVSSGPNIVQPDTTQHGTGQGQAPGPPVNIDNSINVQAGVDPGQILQPVQEQQNANNASLHTFTGGLPQ